MKKLLTLSMALLTALSLTAVARADVIASPGETVLLYTMCFLPGILVAAAVLITILYADKILEKEEMRY